MITGVDPHPSGAIDLGADRELRETLCMVHPWCVESAGYEGPCRMFHTCVNGPLQVVDFGPEASKRRRY